MSEKLRSTSLLDSITIDHGPRDLLAQMFIQGESMARAKGLLKHPDFSLRNPNRVRALLVSLCRDNPAAFHRADASGYVFWAERLVELDAINPSLAGRLARVMDRWSHLAEPYRSAAREAIERRLDARVAQVGDDVFGRDAVVGGKRGLADRIFQVHDHALPGLADAVRDAEGCAEVEGKWFVR